jgi:hypothetical protein
MVPITAPCPSQIQQSPPDAADDVKVVLAVGVIEPNGPCAALVRAPFVFQRSLSGLAAPRQARRIFQVQDGRAAMRTAPFSSPRSSR